MEVLRFWVCVCHGLLGRWCGGVCSEHNGHAHERTLAEAAAAGLVLHRSHGLGRGLCLLRHHRVAAVTCVCMYVWCVFGWVGMLHIYHDHHTNHHTNHKPAVVGTDALDDLEEERGAVPDGAGEDLFVCFGIVGSWVLLGVAAGSRVFYMFLIFIYVCTCLYISQSLSKYLEEHPLVVLVRQQAQLLDAAVLLGGQRACAREGSVWGGKGVMVSTYADISIISLYIYVG